MKGGIEIAANSEKTAKKPRGKPFAPGQSGNPAGRPKLTDKQKDAMETIRELSPAAAEVLRELLTNQEASAAIRIKAAEIVLDRTYGKPTTVIDVAPPPDMSALERAFEIPMDDE